MAKVGGLAKGEQNGPKEDVFLVPIMKPFRWSVFLSCIFLLTQADGAQDEIEQYALSLTGSKYRQLSNPDFVRIVQPRRNEIIPLLHLWLIDDPRNYGDDVRDQALAVLVRLADERALAWVGERIVREDQPDLWPRTSLHSFVFLEHIVYTGDQPRLIPLFARVLHEPGDPAILREIGIPERRVRTASKSLLAAEMILVMAEKCTEMPRDVQEWAREARATGDTLWGIQEARNFLVQKAREFWHANEAALVAGDFDAVVPPTPTAAPPDSQRQVPTVPATTIVSSKDVVVTPEAGVFWQSVAIAVGSLAVLLTLLGWIRRHKKP